MNFVLPFTSRQLQVTVSVLFKPHENIKPKHSVKIIHMAYVIIWCKIFTKTHHPRLRFTLFAHWLRHDANLNQVFCSRLMEKKYVKWLVAMFILLLAVYLVQHPKYVPNQLKQELQEKVVVICGASSGEYLLYISLYHNH